MNPTIKKYEFDVALTFAGANRDVAEQIAQRFKSAGLSVFYDKDRFAHLWGKRECEFERIYSSASRYVVPILSEHYPRQDWCMHELSVAKREAKRRKGEFILPIRLDDTPVLGIPHGVIFADPSRQDIEEITEAMLTKLGKVSAKRPSSRAVARRGSRNCGASARVLPPSRHRVLGIVAVSPLPFAVEDFSKLFPDIDWKAEVRHLRQVACVSLKEGRVTVPTRVRRSLLPSKSDEESFLKRWIDVLQPLKWHPDTGLFLSIQLMRAGRFGESIEVLTDVAEALQPGPWNDTYSSTLLHAKDRRVQRRLSAEQRVRWLNAVGLCLTRKGDHREAVKWFLKLRSYSRRTGDQWGIGQSYINCGVAYTKLNELPRAEDCYRKAVDHSRRTKDDHLLGRSLHNLALTIMLRSPDAARRLLNESAAAKRLAKDRQGQTGVHTGKGLVEAHAGNPRLALRWFCKAAAMAKQLDDRWTLSNALSNAGTALFELGEYREALKDYVKARKLAEDEGFLHAAPDSLQGEAMTRERLGQFKRGEKSFRQLYAIARNRHEWDGAVCALHAVGVMLLRQKKGPEARRVFASACRLARQKELDDWVCKCQSDQAISYLEAEKDDRRAAKWLRSAATKEEKLRAPGVAGRLWEGLARLLVGHGGRTDQIDDAFRRAIACLDKAEAEPDALLELRADFCAWQWDAQDYSGAIDGLRELERKAAEHHHKEWQFRALDQLGVCLQELERYSEAAKAHRRALTIARRLDDTEWAENCLNNLGELLRHTNHPGAATDCFVEAEALAEAREDYESSISIAHNRSLVLARQRDFDGAGRLLRRCRDIARKRGIQGEYVRALHGLANLAWMEGKRRTAERRYAKTLAEAKRRNVSEQLCPISLNYSNALSCRGDARRAIRVLAPLEESFAKLPGAHTYWTQLASLHQEVGDLERAEPRWRAALNHATLIGHRDAVATSAGGLAEICEEDGRLQEADRHLLIALEHEPEPELRMVLLLHRLQVLLRMNEEKAAEGVFEELQSLGQEHALREDLVDGYLTVGDYYWEHGKPKREAAKAYAAALGSSSFLDSEHMAETCIRIAARLASIGGKRRGYRIRQLGKQLATWLLEEQGIEKGDVAIRHVLWPFRIAERIVT